MDGTIAMSKPCSNCIQMLSTLPKHLGYNIKHVFYSENDGSITKTTLARLANSEQHVSIFYRKL